MSLYANYLKERHGVETIETPGGFLTYRIQAPECFLRDIYVAPEARREELGSVMVAKMEQIALEKGCKHVAATIVPSAAGATEALHAALHIGMRVAQVRGDAIILVKELSHG